MTLLGESGSPVPDRHLPPSVAFDPAGVVEEKEQSLDELFGREVLLVSASCVDRPPCTGFFPSLSLDGPFFSIWPGHIECDSWLPA